MTERKSNSDDGSQDPYSMLGLNPGASFEDAQRARDKRLEEIGEDDPILKARIEASFDSLLMNSLKARQLGKISNEAFNASKRENLNKTQIGGGNILTRLSSLDFSSSDKKDQNLFPAVNIPQGQDLITRIALGLLGITLILISPDESTQIILSLSTIILLISYVKGGRGIFRSLGWSVVFLSIGLIIGGIIVSGMSNVTSQFHAFTPNKIQALVAILFIWIGSLF